MTYFLILVCKNFKMSEMEEDPGTDEDEMDTDSSVESGTSRISFRIRVTPDPSKKQVSVLMLTPRWRFDDFGMATITRSLVQNLRIIDQKGTFIKITCAVLEEDGNISRDQQEDAVKVNVQLVGYSRPRGDRGKPELHWLDKSIATYYSDLAYARNVNYDFIVGHVPYLTNGCLNLKDIFVKRGVNCTAILVIHDLPRKENGEVDEEQLRELSDADLLLFMKKSIHDDLQRRDIFQEQESRPDYKMYFPVFPVEHFKVHRTECGGSKKIMVMTREKRKLNVEGMDLSLAINSITEVSRRTNTDLTINFFTENNGESADWANEFNIPCQAILDTEDLEYQMRHCQLFLLPHQVSSPLFGSEALSAVAAGVPVLVPKHSAVGSLLLEMNANNSVISEPHIDAWAQRITQIIENPGAAQHEAANLKDLLLLDTRISSSHVDFINIITGMYQDAFHF